MVYGLPGALERVLQLRLGVVPGRDLAEELRRAASTASPEYVRPKSP